MSLQHPGIQLWTVPVSGLWSIEARGASGADGILVGSSANRKRGGLGAIVKGKFLLRKSRVIKILVGHEGSRDPIDPHRPGGGGGGTFVVYEDGKPLLVAGGGGGGGIPRASKHTCLIKLITMNIVVTPRVAPYPFYLISSLLNLSQESNGLQI